MSKNERLAKVRRENSNVYAKRTCHPRIGEEGILLDLLYCLGVPRGDREANRTLHAGDHYREYRSTALVNCLEWAKSYAQEFGGPCKDNEGKIGSVTQGGDVSPADPEPTVSDSVTKLHAEHDMSLNCSDKKGTGESSETSDMSPGVGRVGMGEQQTFWDVI